jgi:hypothetical protein
VIRCGYQAVLVEVVVIRRDGTYHSDLTVRDFIVTEDGKHQPIVYMTQEPIRDRDFSGMIYKIGYLGPFEWDGTFRSIRVRVVNQRKRGLRVGYFPEGYFAVKSTSE